MWWCVWWYVWLIHLYNKGCLKLHKKPTNDRIEKFVSSKQVVSLVLLFLLIGVSFTSDVSWSSALIYNTSSGDINAIFYNEFFSVLILADVFILLLSFQYTERYNQIIRNTGFIICTILIRLSTTIFLTLVFIDFSIYTLYNVSLYFAHLISRQGFFSNDYIFRKFIWHEFTFYRINY